MKLNLAKAKTLLSKRSPEIWLGAGIVAIVGGTIWACYASRKLDDILDEHEYEKYALENERDSLIDDANDEEKPDSKELAVIEKNYKKDCAKLTLTTGLSLARSYAPAVLLISGGIGMVITGHNILNKRNATLLAAYTTLDQSFSEYRSRVKARFGDDIEQELYSGVTYTEEKVTVTDEDGKKHKEVVKTPVVGTSTSPYGRFFDEANSTEWQRSPDYNHTFLICQQNSANDKLRRKGYLFLNEVYKMLGMSETPTGAICGWIMPEENDPLHEGDAFVDFGIFDATDPNKRAFVNGQENSIYLDFNCQGPIWNLI